MLALDERGSQRPDVLDRRALGQITQRLSERAACRNLNRDQGQFGADRLALAIGLLADDLDRFEQPKARLDANDQQIEHVGELARDILLAPVRAPAQIVQRSEITDRERIR